MVINDLKYWGCLVVAALFEAAWTFSLKMMKFSEIKKLNLGNFYKTEGLSFLLPFVGYVLFGLCNVYFFSLAMKKIPAATALAVWMAFSLVFVKAAEVFAMHQKTTAAEMFFMCLILVGIIGMKVYAAPLTP